MKTIYTAIFSNYEELKEPTVISEGWEYVCYTNMPLKSNVWKIIYCAVDDPIIAARLVKHTYFTRFGKSIWVDGSFQINCDLNKWWEENFTSPFTVIQHPLRNCIYTEATTCIGNKRGNDRDIRDQADFYRKEGVPDCFGLIQSGILMRENTDEVKKFCSLWHNEIKRSTRDQIGFAYVEFKLGFKWPRIQYNYIKGQEFKFTTHYKRRKNANAYRGY